MMPWMSYGVYGPGGIWWITSMIVPLIFLGVVICWAVYLAVKNALRDSTKERNGP